MNGRVAGDVWEERGEVKGGAMDQIVVDQNENPFTTTQIDEELLQDGLCLKNCTFFFT